MFQLGLRRMYKTAALTLFRAFNFKITEAICFSTVRGDIFNFIAASLSVSPHAIRVNTVCSLCDNFIKLPSDSGYKININLRIVFLINNISIQKNKGGTY